MKLLYDWLVLPPAVLIDCVLLCLFGLAALVPPTLAWHCTVKVIESNEFTWRDYPAKPRRIKTRIVAFVVSAYVALVCMVAVYELPHVFYKIVGPENSN